MGRLFAGNATYTVPATNDRKGYEAGKLSQLGLETMYGTYSFELKAWFGAVYKVDRKTGQYELNTPTDIAERRAIQALFNDRICPIMAADFKKERTLNDWLDVYENDNVFFEQCYRAAVLQNESIDPEQYAIYQLEIEAQELQNQLGKGEAVETNPLELSAREGVPG